MRTIFLSIIYVLTAISLISCDQIPEEGTIVYDVDFPRADSCEASGTCGSGGGGGGGGSQGPTNPGIPSTPAGVTVVNTTPQITENNTYTGTTIVLDASPAGTVTISVSSGDLTEVVVGSSTLTFDSSNWSTPQTIVQTAIEDYEVDGNQITGVSYTIVSTNTSDPVHGKFGNIATQTIDSQRDLFTIGGGTPTVAEAASDNTTYTFVLDDAPSGAITVVLTSTDTNEVVIGTPLTFTPGAYNVPQALSLTGIQDYITDGLQTVSITANFSSTDTNDIHHGKTNSFNVNVTDSGLSSITLDNANPSVAEGSSYSGTIVLDNPPNGTVTLTLTSSDTTEARIVPDPTVLTFTPANYNTPQGYTINGIEDFIADNDQNININVVASSTDNTDSIHGLSTSFTATVQDSGIASPFTINPTTPSLAEGTTDNGTTIVLTYPPTQNVTVTLTSGDSSEVQFSPSPQTFTFTPSNWNQTQPVTIVAPNDFILDNDQSTAITVNLASTDPNYDNVTDTFNVTTTDNVGMGPTTLTSATGGTQKVTLGISGPSGMDSYTIYYTSDGSTPTLASDNVSDISGTATSYVHGGLTSGLTYTYRIVANLGSDSSGLSPTVSATPTSFTGCTTSGTLTDTDPDLLVHYPFSNNLNDVKNLGTTGSPYTLTNVTSWGSNSVSGTIRYAQGCAHGQAAYFDSTTGYLVNEDFDQTNVTALSDNYTVSMWVYPETSGTQGRVALNSGFNTNGPDFQLEYKESTSYFEWNAVEKIKVTSYPAYQWYHVALVKHNNGTGSIYVNGTLASSINNHSTGWDQIGMGISRSRGTAGHWKGYIDEVKVFGRAFSGNEVVDGCLLYGECEKYVKPNTPTGLTATDPGSGTSINLTWNASTGTDNYTVYWTDDPSTPIDPSNPSTYDGSTTVTGTSTTVTGLTTGTPYDFTVIATNTAGNSSPATEVNATPTLVLPAAVDNVTAYHGFDRAYGYNRTFNKTNNFNPSYLVTWERHPDAGGSDWYYVYISDNASVPIDPDNASTYLQRQTQYHTWGSGKLTRNIPTRPKTIDSSNDDFLVGKAPRFAVVFYDASKGVYSPISNQVTPPMASEALREIGDLRIQSGYFSADNSTLSSFARTTAIGIVHKDMINVGERFIIDGAFLSSDVIPQMGNSGYDVLQLNFFNPPYGIIYSDGSHFEYYNKARYLQTNMISSNSICGTNHSADCDFGMEIQGEDSVGMIIHNGTLNGSTDYAADESSAPVYSKEKTGSHNVDNASYVGLYVYTNDNVQVEINLANADAAISKVAIPFPSPANLTATPSSSNINLSWDNSTVYTNTYDIYRSTDNASWSLVTSISGYGNTTYTDASLADNTYYYKIGANGTYYTPDNSTVVSGVISTTPAAPVLNSVTAGVQQNTIAWSAYTGATGYKLYWDTSASVSTSDNLITISDNSSTSYIHSGRTAGTQYYYRLIATTSGGDSTLSNELSDTPTAFVGCTSSGAVADNDPDLLVHYAFEGNLEDIEDTNSDNRYDLTNEEGTMQFAQGCAQGQAAYIDTSSGYGVNTQFTSSNVGGNLANDNFSISLWVAKDGDMGGFSSTFNTGFYAQHSPSGSQEKAQIDIDDSGKLRMISNSPSSGRKVRSSSAANMNQWYHVVAVHNASSDITLYVDGVAEETNTNMNVEFYGLVVGLNRSRSVGSLNWKGYIDEVKVFGRTFSADDVADDCMKSEGCPYVPATAPTLSADARAQAIMLTWNLPGGTDNATIYWRTSGGSFEGSPTAPTASDNVINVTDNQTSYLLTGLTGGNYYHFVIKANNKNGSSPVSSVLGNVQPTSFIANTFDSHNAGLCKIQNDGSLHCKGRNNLDQYDTSRTAKTSAVDVFGISNAETISHDYNKVSVIKSDGSYQHRGNDDGRGSLTSPVTGVTNPIQVEQGYDFVAYLMSDGTIRTRGDNTYGQLGNGNNSNNTTTSETVSGISTATKIVTGQWHMCALLSNGQVWCWGVNSFGELGDGTTTHRNTPVQASLPSNTAVDIFVGSRTSAAVLANGKVYIWGNNNNSRAKCDTNTNNISTPRELTVVSNVKQIDFGTGHSVILTNDGNVYTCGTVYSSTNVAGNAAFYATMGAAEKTNGAILMDDYQGRVVEVRADSYNSYMLLDNGSLACIGSNEHGQCNNDGSTRGTNQITPIIIPDM